MHELYIMHKGCVFSLKKIHFSICWVNCWFGIKQNFLSRSTLFIYLFKIY